eukprot:m.219555 g.219555  ORF g.219555 m.219555 type:complete len:88 (+) comp25759_c0_seq2:2191-2454(+)
MLPLIYIFIAIGDESVNSAVLFLDDLDVVVVERRGNHKVGIWKEALHLSRGDVRASPQIQRVQHVAAVGHAVQPERSNLATPRKAEL